MAQFQGGRLGLDICRTAPRRYTLALVHSRYSGMEQ